MDVRIIEDALQRQMAVQFLASLSPEQKETILAAGVERMLGELHLEWEIKELLRNEARKFAVEYVKRPEVRDRLRANAEAALEQVMNGIVLAIAKDIEYTIKSEYKSFVKET